MCDFKHLMGWCRGFEETILPPETQELIIATHREGGRTHNQQESETWAGAVPREATGAGRIRSRNLRGTFPATASHQHRETHRRGKPGGLRPGPSAPSPPLHGCVPGPQLSLGGGAASTPSRCQAGSSCAQSGHSTRLWCRGRSPEPSRNPSSHTLLGVLRSPS